MNPAVLNLRKFVGILLLLCATNGMAGEAQGVLHWDDRANLSLPVSGVIEEVLVSAGQTVKQGQVMLKLDTRRAKAQLQAAKARLTRFKPGRDEAERELERAEELFDRTVLSEVELQQVKIDFAEKDAALLEARAAVVEAGLDVEYSELKAPFDLVVLHNHAIKGQAVVNNLQATPLIEVARHRLVASVSLPAKRLAGIKKGQQVKVSYDGKTVAGKITTVTYDAGKQHSVLRIDIADQQAVKGAAGYPVLVTWP